MNVHAQKTVPIEFIQVVKAYAKVKQGGRAAGIDQESWEAFDQKAERNLYVVWNRLASGSYHPQAVREVEIPKKDGKTRKLGIPTLRDRIAQQVVKDFMEKRIDQLFHEHSYGYRPMKSAHQAIEQVRLNCYEQNWVIDLDISKFFDEIDHELMLKAVSHVIEEGWVRMYVQRWLEMPIQRANGEIVPRQGKGTPQGGVISPLLANLYLHYALDIWLGKCFPDCRFVRYADDIIVHCSSERQARKVLKAIRTRLQVVKLKINEDKTSIVYCKDYQRKGKFDKVKFDFLGFSYQPRARISKFDGKPYSAFTAEISQANRTKIRDEIRHCIDWKNSTLTPIGIANVLNPKLRGWINYYALYSKRGLRRALLLLEYKLTRWLCHKYRVGLKSAQAKFWALYNAQPNLFYHWTLGYLH